MCALVVANMSRMSFFFFKAEDGIRVLTVTGVQTCALPICPPFIDVPTHILQQAASNPTALESYLRLQAIPPGEGIIGRVWQDRKSTRLNSSHSQISYAVFCL